jgi:hypothetical protein
VAVEVQAAEAVKVEEATEAVSEAAKEAVMEAVPEVAKEVETAVEVTGAEEEEAAGTEAGAWEGGA